MENNFHAFIIGGRDSATRLAASILCVGGADKPCRVCAHCKKAMRGVHPDIETVTLARDKSGNTRKNFTIDQIREIIGKSIVAPNEAAKRVFLIQDAHLIRPEHQGVLLKLLEEPPPHVAVILETDSPNALLPTVRSRCRILQTETDAKSVKQETADLAAEYYAAAEAGEYEAARFSFKLESIERSDLPEFFAETKRIIAQKARSEIAAFPLCKSISAAIKQCEEMFLYNVGTPHIAAYLCTKIFSKK